MNYLRHHRHLRAFVLAIVLIGLVILGARYLDNNSTLASTRRAWAVAKAKWQAQQPSHYRLVYTDGCDIEVRNEQVVNDVQQGCRRPVSRLFQILDDDLTIHWINGYGCDIEAPHVSFNETWGYPEKIEYELEKATATNVGLASYLISRLGTIGGCTLLYVSYGQFVVQSFTPLP